MHTMALVAFLALQLSMFTCGSDIHVHTVDSNLGHIVGHVHNKAGNHEDNSVNHSCHLHASHSFTAYKFVTFSETPSISSEQNYTLAKLNLKSVLNLIEHPPTTLHS